MAPNPDYNKPTYPPRFSLRRRIQLCVALLALECYISYEEIYMLPVLQRVDVPVVLVSLPGTISSTIGVFVIPLLGWASDRLTCGAKVCGQKRLFTIWTLAVALIGIGVLVFITSASLYNHTDDYDPGNNGTISGVTSTITTSASINASTSTVVNGSSLMDGLINATGATLFTGDVTTTALELQDVNLTSSTPNTTSSDHFSSSPWGWNVSSSSSSPGEPDPAELPDVSDEGSSSSDTGYLSTMGILGILGFVLADHGYDSSMSTFKAYMIAVTPSSQHDELLVMGTLAGAVGGCFTSLLGFVDLSSIFRSDSGAVLDEGIAQCLVQSMILLAGLLVFCSISLSTGSEQQQAYMSTVGSSNAFIGESCMDEHDNDDSKPLCHNGTNETTPLVVDSFPGVTSDSCLGRLASVLKRWKQQILVCVMAFLGLATNYAYFVYVTNYVAEVIYQGEPTAETGSPAYESYVEGVHMASLGMLTFYCLFVVYNVFHNKILTTIGMKNEYLLASAGCIVLMLTLFLTDNIVVFFLNAATMAVFRSAVYTIPFILSNNYAKEEQEAGGDSARSSGVAMATVSAMIPGSYFMVSLLMGPLMDVTGSPGTPMLFAVVSAILGMISALFVKFK